MKRDSKPGELSDEDRTSIARVAVDHIRETTYRAPESAYEDTSKFVKRSGEPLRAWKFCPHCGEALR